MSSLRGQGHGRGTRVPEVGSGVAIHQEKALASVEFAAGGSLPRSARKGYKGTER